MKQKLRLFTSLLLLAVASVGWGADVSFAPSNFSGQGTSGTGSAISATVDGVTFACDKGYGTTQIRCYSGGVITISSSNTITAISFTFSGSYNGGLETSYTDLSTTSWEKTLSSQARITSVTVTYTTGSNPPTPTTYTITFDAGEGTFVGNTDFPNTSNSKEAGTYTLPSATRDGFTFDGWVTGTNNPITGLYSVSNNVDFTAQYTENAPAGDYEWVLTDLADLTASDVFVIVGDNGDNYAMSNNNGASTSPTAVPVTVEGNKLSEEPNANIQWNVSSNATDGYTFYPNGSTTTWLYCINSNSGVRVGTNVNKYFVIRDDYLFNTGQGRYLGIYNSTDWRCYTSIVSNIANQTFKFYKRVEKGATQAPFITASNVNIEYSATSGNIEFTVNNPVTGGVLSASTQDNWITLGNQMTSPISFTCTPNGETTARTATVTLTYTYDDNQTVSKSVTVTQAAAPQSYTTIPDLFAAAAEVGSTGTNVNVTFGNWVVSGVSGSNVFVTDNNGNGFIIYKSSHGFDVNDKLSGTVFNTPLKLYNGAAEFTNLTASTEGLSVTNDGEITAITNIAMADLAGVNTGALVSYQNLTCSVNNNKYYLSDGTTTLQVYNALYAFEALEEGKTYSITGVYQQFNNTKEIMPRSAADIVEVVVTSDLTWTAGANTVLHVFNAADPNNQLSSPASVTAGTEILVSVDVAEGYVIQSLIVDGNNVTSQIDETGAYTFTMPAHDVTITSTAEEYVAPVSATYTLATSITSGKRYVIASGTEGTIKVMGNQASNNRPGVEASVVDGVLSVSDEYEFVIESATYGEASGYSIFDASENGGYLYAASSSSNHLKTQDRNDANGIWTIKFEDGHASIEAESSSNRNVMQYNSSSSLFSCYSSASQKPVYLFEKVEETPEPETVTATITDAGYATFANENPIDFSAEAGLTVMTAQYDDFTGKINYTIVESKKVPAATAVVLKGEAKDYTGVVIEEAPALTTNNDLKVNLTESFASNGTQYCLAKKNEVVGFYKVKDGVNVKAGKAYLVITGQNAKDFYAIEDEIDGINTIGNSQLATDKVYNLAGQRVNKAQKGIYIVNGKKVVIK